MSADGQTITCVCGNPLTLKRWARPTVCDCGEEWCRNGHHRTSDNLGKRRINGRDVRVCLACQREGVARVRENPDFRNREAARTSARGRALTRLARMYPATFNDLYRQECEKVGVELER